MSVRLTPSEAKKIGIEAKPRRNKFNAKPVVYDGIRFDSQMEGQYYLNLKRLERVGEVYGLRVHPKFKLAEPEGMRPLTYTADFAFWDKREDRFRIVDVKGVETRSFKDKRKLMKAVHGLDVEIVRKGDL